MFGLTRNFHSAEHLSRSGFLGRVRERVSAAAHDHGRQADLGQTKKEQMLQLSSGDLGVERRSKSMVKLVLGVTSTYTRVWRLE